MAFEIRSPTMAMTPAVMSSSRLLIGGNSARKRRPNCEWRIRSGSEAIARKGKIEVTPITWKMPWANDRKNTNASFFRPYGRARNRTRRIRSEALWRNRDKEVPSYTFRKSGASHPASARVCQVSAGKTQVSKKDRGPIMDSASSHQAQTFDLLLCRV